MRNINSTNLRKIKSIKTSKLLFLILFAYIYCNHSIVNASSFELKCSENISFVASEDIIFAKKTSVFLHQYALILNFKQGDKLSLFAINQSVNFKLDSDNWTAEYLEKKETLTDEFKIANKEGIIDHYSKRDLYSAVYNRIENIKKNTFLQGEIERVIEYPKNEFISEFSNYHKQFPTYFIEKQRQIAIIEEFYTDLGFVFSNEIATELNQLKDQSKGLDDYAKSPEYETLCINKNANILSYSYLNTDDNTSAFKQYSFTKTTVHPTLLGWLKKEGSIFKTNPSDYVIFEIIPISNGFGRYLWGNWSSKDGDVVRNAYALKQTFIVTFKEISTGKCYASNFTASYLESNNVLVSNDKIKLIHKRLIPCRK